MVENNIKINSIFKFKGLATNERMTKKDFVVKTIIGTLVVTYKYPALWPKPMTILNLTTLVSGSYFKNVPVFTGL